MQLKNKSLDLISAALRHMRDAEHLASDSENQSLDQAYHLAGFAPECIRKAILGRPSLNKILGHDLSTTSNKVIEMALAIDPMAHRYQLDREPPESLSRWKPDCRYEKTGSKGTNEAQPLLNDAQELVHGLIAELWADGRLETIPE